MYSPQNVPSSPNDLPAFIEAENRAIAETLNEGVVYLRRLNNPPKRLYEGMTVLADGTNWNPGSGQGVYTYYNSTWNKLG